MDLLACRAGFSFFLVFDVLFWLIPKCDSTGLSIKVATVVAETSTGETKHHTQRVGELRFIMPVGLEELVNTPRFEPRTKGLQSFYTRTGMIKQACRGWAIAKRRTRVSEISSSS